MSDVADRPKRAILRQAGSISVALVPFGVAFGVACAEGGLTIMEAVGFSALVFTGSAQLAAVSVLSAGGTVTAAVVAGVLLNLRSLAFGIVMAPALKGPFWWRAIVSQLMIDESTAVGSGQPTRELARFGYLAGGIGVFVFWNGSTLLGASVLGGADDLIHNAGIDATIPAAFLALLWPRLRDSSERAVALAGATIAFMASPILPAGLPIIAAALAVLVVRPWEPTT